MVVGVLDKIVDSVLKASPATILFMVAIFCGFLAFCEIDDKGRIRLHNPQINQKRVLAIGLASLVASIIISFLPKESPLCEKFECIETPNETMQYGGSTSWIPIKDGVENVVKQEKPNFNLQYIIPNEKICQEIGITESSECIPGSDIGIRMLLDGRLDFSLSSRPLDPQETREGLKSIPVANDAVVLIVNPELDVDELKPEDIKSIYTGDQNFWGAYGSRKYQNQEIIPYSREPGTAGTVDFFVDKALHNEEMNNSVVVYVGTTTRGIGNVANNKGGIFYASGPEVIGQCSVKPLKIVNSNFSGSIAPYAGSYILPADCPAKRNTLNIENIQAKKYLLTRELFVIVRTDDDDKEKAGEAYVNLLLTEQGQTVIQAAGYLKLKD